MLEDKHSSSIEIDTIKNNNKFIKKEGEKKIFIIIVDV